MVSSNRPLKFWGCFKKVNKHQLVTCVGRHLRVLQTTVKCSCILQTDSYQLLHANKAATRPSLSLQYYYFQHFEETALDKRENTFLQKNEMFEIISDYCRNSYKKFSEKAIAFTAAINTFIESFSHYAFYPNMNGYQTNGCSENTEQVVWQPSATVKPDILGTFTSVRWKQGVCSKQVLTYWAKIANY